MKANQTPAPPRFVPVEIILESQAEVDELYALLITNKLDDCVPVLGKQWELLRPFRDRDKSEAISSEITALMK